MDEPSVSVPLQLFDENHKEDYLKTAVDINEKRIAQKNELSQLDQVIGYSMDTAIGKSLNDIYPNATAVHLSTALLRPLSAFSFGKARKIMFIHLRKGHFDLFLFQGGQLLLQNAFSHTAMRMNLCISCFMCVNNSTLSQSNLICFFWGNTHSTTITTTVPKSFILPLSI